MDKKNTIIGVVLLIAAFASYILSSKLSPPVSTPVPELARPADGSTPAAATAPSAQGSELYAAIVNNSTDAQVTTIANDYIELHLTNLGGAIRDVGFKKYPDVKGGKDPYIFNQLHAAPILAIGDFPGLDQKTPFTLVSATTTEVVYRAVIDKNIEVTRRYALASSLTPAGDPYRVRHETTFRNLTDQTITLPRATINLGTASLTSAKDDGIYLNSVSYDGEDTHFTDRGELQGGGMLSFLGLSNNPPKPFIEKNNSLLWASVKNRFFASIVTFDKPAISIITRRVDLPKFPDSTHENIGLTASARVDLPAMAAAGSTTFGSLVYLGPKEYTRLSKFDHREDKVMQFDRYFFNRIFLSGLIAPFMNWLMNLTHNMVGNWGVAIVLMTLLLKIVTLPLTLAASKSGKRMQKLQPEMAAMKEKYKDDPKKMQMATMELFKKHRVNPVGGCIPILITIPLFIGFFAMLQGTAELRFQSFLWVTDLSVPDTVATVFGFPINIMPILMGATMVFQMRLVPQPSIDNTQAKILKFMPILFTFFCYGFAAALALYSTVNGVFTIAQQLMVNRMKDEEPVVATPAATGGRGVKNVTPKKK